MSAAVGKKRHIHLAIVERREGEQEVGEHVVFLLPDQRKEVLFCFSKIKTKKIYRMYLTFCDWLP